MATTDTSTVNLSEIDVAEDSTCQHKWLIESPNGPSSMGTCLDCDATKDFPNYIEGSAWGYDVPVEQLNLKSRTSNAVIEDNDA